MIGTRLPNKRQVCAFTLGDHLFGIEVNYIQEVFRFQECTPLPLTPPFVKGLLNLRGKIVLAIGLRERLGMAERPGGKSPTSIVVQIDDGALCFLVDELFDIMSLDSADFETIPKTLSATEKKFVSGCYKLEDRLLILLDTVGVADIAKSLGLALEESQARSKYRETITVSELA